MIGHHENETYSEFVGKFKPKHTSDDCFTPDNIYKVVADWVSDEYGLDQSTFFRPFWPGGDYTKENYDGKIVVDNPPFSMISEIIRFYIKNNVKFFLFANHITLISTDHADFDKFTRLVCGTTITYENGAKVSTSFLTNLGDKFAIMTVPDLADKLKKADEQNRHDKKVTRHLPNYTYPKNVVRITDLTRCIKSTNERLKINFDECSPVDVLDDQKAHHKKLFGTALFVSDSLASQIDALKKKTIKKKTINWVLSSRERKIIDGLK